MLPSKCYYFSKMNCPFFDDICNRPHCHFRHSKKVKNNVQKKSDSNKIQENDNLFIKHVVKETVKHVFSRIDLKDGNEGNPDISSVVEDVVSDIQNSATNAKFLTLFSKSQVIPQYKPTPIEKLKINRHIPVQVAPTRPSYQLSSCRSRNAASVHAVKYIHKNYHLDEGKQNFQNYLPTTTSDLTKDKGGLPNFSNISSLSPSGNISKVTSDSDSWNKNDNPGFTGHSFIHSLSADAKQIHFEYYTSKRADKDFLEFNDKSVVSIDKNKESEDIDICNKMPGIKLIKQQCSQKKNESDLNVETAKHDEKKEGHKISYNQTSKEEENKVKTEVFNKKKKEKSLREIGTIKTEGLTERLGKTRRKLHEHLENKLDYGCAQKSLKINEKLRNLEDENLSYKETVSEFSEQKITIGDTSKISPKETKNTHKVYINGDRRLSIVGGGLPCNSLLSGPFMDVLVRWRKAKEKIRKSTSRDNKKIVTVDNEESVIDEKNELLFPTPTRPQQTFNESGELLMPRVKRRIAHQNNLDPTVSAILEQKLKKARRSF